MPELTRAAPIGASTFNAETRTVSAIVASERPVQRSWDRPDRLGQRGAWIEILPAAAADLSRAPGASLLLDHVASARQRIGVIEAAEVVGSEVHARLKFSGRPEFAGLIEDIGTLGGQLSVGYSAQFDGPDDPRAEVPVFRASSWTLLEASVVAVSADPAARFRSHEGTMMEDHAPPAAPAPEAAAERRGPLNLTLPEANPAGSAAEWLELSRFAHKEQLPQDLLTRAADEGLGINAARTLVFEAAAEQDTRRQIIRAPSMITGGHDGDDPDFRRRQCEDALVHRLSGGRIALPESAAPVRGMALRDMGEYVGEQSVRNWQGQRAGFAGHVTTDFPILLLEGAGQRTLAEAFTVAASPLRQVSRVIQVDDFRDITRARRGEAAKLLEIEEHGEVKSSTVGEEYERYKVKTYARNFLLTRNAIIQDDLNAFADFLSDMGRAAATTEAGVLVALITGNGVTLSDGSPLWHVNHGNLATAAAALDVGPLGIARREMRLQKSPTNDEPLNLTPRYLLVPAALETTADQLVAAISATEHANVNPFSGRLTILVEPRLDAASSTAWFVVADPASMPFIEIATLNGSRPMSTAGAPELRTFEGEDVLGVKYRAVHDFGAWPVNYRAAFKNAGQ